MNQKHIANILSVTRIILSIIYFYIFYIMLRTSDKQIMILALGLFSVIIITDYLDGKAARKTQSSTKNGALLDVTADMIFVLVSYTALYITHNMHIIFLILLIFKFMEFIVTSRLNRNPEKNVIFDKIGKNVSKAWIGFPGIICILELVKITQISQITNTFMLITGILALLSTTDRIRTLI